MGLTRGERGALDVHWLSSRYLLVSDSARRGASGPVSSADTDVLDERYVLERGGFGQV